jgi:carbonic anhydrase
MPTENIEILFDNNRKWAAGLKKQDPKFFEDLARQQTPQFLWIGCSDSRVPASSLNGLLPGELFVHRNIANLVYNTDPSCMSVLQYAVEALQVQHIIVCGHYGCGGVQAAMLDKADGVLGDWIKTVQNTYHAHQEELDSIVDGNQRLNRLCEINVHEQVKNICQSNVVQSAWDKNQDLTVHGWIYDLREGLLHTLEKVNS